MAAGVPWKWGTFGDYLDAVDATPKSMNYAGYVGHSALRTYVMGERAYTDLATDADLAEMRQVLTESMRQGAIGFSSSRTTVHRTYAGDPVASYIANWDELRSLVGVLGELGAGVFEVAAGLSDPEIRDALRTIALESGRPVHVAVAQPLRGPEDQWRVSLEFLDQVAAEGGRIIGQAHVRQLSNVSGFQLTLPYDRLPRWSELRARPVEEQLSRLRDERTRRELVDEAMHWQYAEGDVIAEVGSRPPNYDHIFVLESATATNPTVAEVAAVRGCTPVDVVIDLSIERGFDQFFLHVFGNRNLDDVLPVLEHPRTVVAGSDAGAHVSQVMESCATSYFLAHWVRDTGAFSLEEGVRLLTSKPAAEWELSDRGRVAEGFAADAVLFDPATVGPELPKVVHDLPSGGKRLVQRAQGIYGTVVNGEVVSHDGEFSDARPGRLLRGPLYEEGAPA